MIFDQQHLAVVRAALRFWTDEMRPDSIDIWRHYFEHPDDVPDTTAAAETQRLFATCRLLPVERCDGGLICAEASSTPDCGFVAIIAFNCLE